MDNYGGVLLALRDAFVFLALAALVVSLGGAFLLAVLAIWHWLALVMWPALVALTHDGRTWIALAGAVLAIALLWLPRMRPGTFAQPAQSLEQDAPDWCERCGSERPDLICPMCGAPALDKLA